MFKYKPLIILLQLLLIFVACNTVVEKSDSTHTYDVANHNHVIHETDSILVLADEGFKVMKQHHLEQRVFVDSLEYTIEREQSTINNLNKEVIRRVGVDEILQLTKGQLEETLISCERKENKVNELKEKLALKSEESMDEKVYLINFYNNKVDSLKDIIMTLKNTPIIDTVYLNKRNYRKQNNQ